VEAVFFINSILLGIGLAMDTFSISIANGLAYPDMKKGKMLSYPLTFAAFQFAMPMIGYICVHTVLEHFKVFEAFIPWIALGLLGFIGTKMIIEAVKGGEDAKPSLAVSALFLQGIATSIDALSVGFTISAYGIKEALLCALIIGIVTFVISIAGFYIGKRFGGRNSGKAGIIGGVILIIIGVEIFVTNIAFG